MTARRKTIKRTTKRKHPIHKRIVNKLSRGSITFNILIGIVIIGAVLLVSGATPQYQNTPRNKEQSGVIPVVEEPDSNTRQSLRLRTIKFKECAATSAVTLQLDITGSMETALPDLKNAVYTFTEQLSDDSVIGIQAYSDRNARMEVIPVSLYKDVREQIRPKVGALRSGGGTPSYAALNFSREVLQQAIPLYPERQFSFIFFSDGNPNVGPSTDADIAQAAQGIKDLGVTVYAIGLGAVNRSVIEAVASSPDKAIVTTNSKELERIYSEISFQMCGAPQ